MTVAELKAKLNEFSDDTVVFTYDSEEGFEEVNGLTPKAMYLRDFNGRQYWSDGENNSSKTVRQVKGIQLGC